MMPLHELKVKSAKMKRGIQAADPMPSKSKRNVQSIINNLNKKLDLEKPVSDHVLSVIKQSDVGKQSSLGQHLIHMDKLNKLGDHQYVTKEIFEKNVLCINTDKRKEIERESY